MAEDTPETPAWPLSLHENDGLSKYGGRDMSGYGDKPPAPKWPKNAKVALNFVINYEEGAEACLLHGDNQSEKLLSEIVGAESYEGQRHMNMESLYDYGSRAGFWRLHRLFTKKKVPVTVFAVGMALERNPAVCHALKETESWEVASHGYRWADYQNIDPETEKEHMDRTIKIHEKLLGKRPVGFYQGKPNVNTRAMVVEEGGFKYDSDSYADDLPYWTLDYGPKPHLIIPYTLTTNDMRFVSPSNYGHGGDFCQHLKDTLKFLIEEGRAGMPKMMTVGLHCRLAHPGRVSGLQEFLAFAKTYKDVWFCTREEIADFWERNHYPVGEGSPMKSERDEVSSEGKSEEFSVEPMNIEGAEVEKEKKAEEGGEDEEEGDII